MAFLRKSPAENDGATPSGYEDLLLFAQQMDEMPKERPAEFARRRLMRSYFDKGRDYSHKQHRRSSLPHVDTTKTPQECCASRDFDLLRKLIETGTFEVNEPSPAGFTALAVACVCGLEDFAKYLLEEGADFSLPNLKGATPLHLASRGGHLKVIELLLKAGVLSEMHRKDTYGATPFMEAVHQGHLVAMKILRNHGAFVNDQRNDGATVLHLAAEKGNREIVSFLIEEGSEIDARNDLGETPLFVAATQGNLEAVQLLLLNGAKKDSVSKEGLTPYDVTEDPIIEGILLSSPYEVPKLEDMCVSLIRGSQRLFALDSLPRDQLPPALYQKIVNKY